MDEKKELFKALTRLINLIFWIIIISYILTILVAITSGLIGYYN